VHFILGRARCFASIGVAGVLVLFLAACGKQSTGMKPPSGDGPWKNSLGMTFVAVTGTRVLFSVYETRAGEFEQFIHETKTEWVPPGLESSPEHAAVNVTWDDAVAFCVWLTQRERMARVLVAPQKYRLPSEAEWEAAAEGTVQTYPWGSAWPPPVGAGNFSGEESPVDRDNPDNFVAGYTDEFPRLAPVGRFTPNRFGLHDLAGNATELCADWFDEHHRGRAARGGCWLSGSKETLATARRIEMPARAGLDVVGFRVVLER
jgi:formylglycine-generating enzyme required for sulfatase activity